MIEELKKLKVGKVLHDIKLSKYNTFKIEGNAKALVYPENIECLIKLKKYLVEKKIKHKLLGGGSNLIFVNGYDGVLISLDLFDKIEVKNNLVTVGAGVNLIRLAYKVAKYGLTGFEFASGIPGTLGGAVFMNAGCYGSDMGYVVNKVKVLTPSLEIKTLSNKEMNFHYRTSFLQKNPDYICLEATLFLKNGKKDAILDVMADRKKRRLESQPLDFPSAGSVFRNPVDNAAWKLIEGCGMKGVSVGGAKVSEKHANFIINFNKAKGTDVKELILKVKDNVSKTYDIDLICEQEFVD